MRFKQALWDGTEPLYAPCLSWSRTHAIWKAPKRYVDAGYPTKSINLRMPGSKADDQQEARAQLCRDHTRAMLKWWDDQDESLTDFGTWAYVIKRYRSDTFSTYATVKANTREGYDRLCDKWLEVIGAARIEALTFEHLCQIRDAMHAKDYSVDHVHRMFTQLRQVASHGALISETKDKCREVRYTLSQMRFQTPAKKSTYASRTQVEAIVAAADATGSEDSFIWATGILVQFELTLRAVDVRGQWLKSESEGGIYRNGQRWQDGMTWEMFDKDLTYVEKVISKTARSLPEPYTFDLTGLEHVRKRLLQIRPELPSGPVFVTRRFGVPWTRYSWSQAWRRFRTAAGVSSDIKMMDVRAGAITEAKALGADQYALRDAAQHSNVSTTSRYARDKSDGANKVVSMRQKK